MQPESHAHAVDRGEQRLVEAHQHVEQVLKPDPAAGPAAPVAMAAISRRSWPEVKALPRPVSTTAWTSSSSRAPDRAPATARYMARVEGVAGLGPVEGEHQDAVDELELDPVVVAGVRRPAAVTGGPPGRRRR